MMRDKTTSAMTNGGGRRQERRRVNVDVYDAAVPVFGEEEHVMNVEINGR